MMRSVATILLILVIAPLALPARAAPKAELWNRWQAHDAAANATLDHAPWDRLLTTYLVIGTDGINRFAYGRVTAADRQALEGYIDGLAGISVSRLNRGEQLAYWVNLYNALTVAVVLRHFPVESIRDIDISPGFFADGPWGKKLVTVEGEPISLDDIEHRILRPIWRDPRLHYVVNCASLGCPNLMPAALRANAIDITLDAAARGFINHPRGARVGPDGLVVSKIYDWFKDDFGGGDIGVIAHLGKFAATPLAKAIADGTVIDRFEYDWRLNLGP